MCLVRVNVIIVKMMVIIMIEIIRVRRSVSDSDSGCDNGIRTH